LQGEQKLNPTSQVTESTEPKQHSLPEDKAKEVEKNTDTLSKDAIISVPGKDEKKLLASFEAFMKHGHTFPLSFPNTETPVKDATNPEGSTALSSPIPSLTPLATSSELPGSEVINIDDLTPIQPEEIPSSNLFFNKKRKAIIRREARQKEGVITKKHKMIYDGQGQSDPEFAKEVADSLGAFATANQWSVDNLTKQLEQKNLLIEQLHNDMQQMEMTARNKINFDIEKIRQGFEQQIKQLEDKLELSVQNQHVSNTMLSQRDRLIEQLQSRITLFEST
jgi:hypothetical protein